MIKETTNSFSWKTSIITAVCIVIIFSVAFFLIEKVQKEVNQAMIEVEQNVQGTVY